MARTALAAQDVTTAGLAPALTPANAAGHSIEGDGDVILMVVNGGVGSINVTIQTGATLGGEAVADKVVAVGAGATKLIGRFRPDLYNQASGADEGLVYVDFSGVTSVTVAAISV